MGNDDKMKKEEDILAEIRLEAPYDYLYEHLLFDKGYAKLVIKWGNKISKKNQIIMLKKMCPSLRKLSIVEIFDITKDKEVEWEFTEMGYGEAIDFAESALNLGLEVEIRKIET